MFEACYACCVRLFGLYYSLFSTKNGIVCLACFSSVTILIYLFLVCSESTTASTLVA